MRYLLDTCVLSELVKKSPAAAVTKWLKRQDENNLFVSVLTLGEITKGIERLPDSARKSSLIQWLQTDLTMRFEDRIFDVDSKVASEWGTLAAESERKGKICSPIDGLISATAKVHGCVLVTRNTGDMPLPAKLLLNPWSEN